MPSQAQEKVPTCAFAVAAHWKSGLSTGFDWCAFSWLMKNRLTPTEKNGNRSTLGVLSNCKQGRRTGAAAARR